jgi:hypothetical protein
MTRGGRRRRCITRADAPVCCLGGRWGPRRTRVAECWTVIRAEDVYTGLLRDNASAVRPGARGTATYTFQGCEVTASWEVRQNAVWRRGRVFLACPRCGQRCCRLYLPLKDSWLACRMCWGLTYASRTLQNYKDSLYGRGVFARMFGTSQREWASVNTYEARKRRREAARKRWEERRRWLQPTPSRSRTRST